MIQGSEEWLSIRNQHIGASDAPIIMGVSPWKTVIDLWEEKIFQPDSNRSSFIQRRGLYLEDYAREYFYLVTGKEVFPKVIFSFQYEWLMASLDGISADGKTLVEIKCPGKKDHELAIKGQVPEKYYPQLQHQLRVCELDHMFYLSFDGQKGIILDVYRDEAYIDVMIEREELFWECVEKFSPPKKEDFKPWKRPRGRCLSL